MGNAASAMASIPQLANQQNKPNQYVTAVPQNSISDVCPPPADSYTDADMMAVYPKGIASDSLLPDPNTGRISLDQLQAHISNLESSGVLPPRPVVRLQNTDVTIEETNTPQLVANDTQVFNNAHSEYCYYEQRYKYALKQFLILATSRDQSNNAAAQDLLAKTKILNLRVNSVLEVMNVLAQSRVDKVNMNKTAILNLNNSINKKLTSLTANYNLLNSESAIVTTQKEMVRFTEEKNNYTSHQISVWAALNVISLATIFYVYRN